METRPLGFDEGAGGSRRDCERASHNHQKVSHNLWVEERSFGSYDVRATRAWLPRCVAVSSPAALSGGWWRAPSRQAGAPDGARTSLIATPTRSRAAVPRQAAEHAHQSVKSNPKTEDRSTVGQA